MLESGNAAESIGASMSARASLAEHLPAPHFRFEFECRDAEGNLKWTDGFDNVVTTIGANLLLDTFFAGTAYTAAWFLGLKGVGTAVIADTAASHASWAEVNPYVGNRPALTWTSASAKAKAANGLTYTINATATVAGAFVQTVNTGTTGTLYSAGDFASARSVLSGDSLTVTLTVSV